MESYNFFYDMGNMDEDGLSKYKGLDYQDNDLLVLQVYEEEIEHSIRKRRYWCQSGPNDGIISPPNRN